MKEVEAVVNTRPLTAVGQDLEHILTPSDFLKVGGPIVPEISDRDFLENATVTKKNLVMGWKRGQLFLGEYIKMFSSQYLTSLRDRKKMHKQSRVSVDRIPKIGDLVQIKSDQNRALWKVGRILSVKASSDGQIRVAKVTMSSGEVLTRSIGHLYPLELEDKIIPHTESPRTTLESDMINNDIQLPLDHSKGETQQPIKKLYESNKCEGSESVTQENLENVASEEGCKHLTSVRSKRLSAQSAREKIEQWTKQLFSLIL